MKSHLTLVTALSLLLAAIQAAPPLVAQESGVDDLVKKLKGQAGQSGGLTTRGIKTRGFTPGGGAAPAATTETRSVVLSRGIPTSVKAAAEEDNVALKPSASGGAAVELSYDVDPQSEVSKDNIFFRKGTADFANDSSVAEVVTLADALKHPELKGLKYVIEGHASSEGNDFANQSLSQERAERIVSVLTSLGVEQTRLVPVGFGESKSRFPEGSEESLLKQDRRVLIFRLEK